MQGILNNKKSIENQVSGTGKFLKDKGAPKELSNMFIKLLEYY